MQRWLRELGLGNDDDQDESEPHLSLDKDEIIIYNGETETLTATIFPVSAENKDVVWSSNYTRVATVDDNGVVTTVHPGTAIITARSKTDNSFRVFSCPNTSYVISSASFLCHSECFLPLSFRVLPSSVISSEVEKSLRS